MYCRAMISHHRADSSCLNDKHTKQQLRAIKVMIQDDDFQNDSCNYHVCNLEKYVVVTAGSISSYHHNSQKGEVHNPEAANRKGGEGCVSFQQQNSMEMFSACTNFKMDQYITITRIERMHSLFDHQSITTSS